MGGNHGVQVCEWGFEHGRCRCMDNTIIHVKCDDPRHQLCNEYQPKHAAKVTPRATIAVSECS